jgi:hypothetical protein
MNRRDGYLFRVLQNSKITYRPHCPGTGGGAFFLCLTLKKNQTTMKREKYESQLQLLKVMWEKT